MYIHIQADKPRLTTQNLLPNNYVIFFLKIKVFSIVDENFDLNTSVFKKNFPKQVQEGLIEETEPQIMVFYLISKVHTKRQTKCKN